MRSIVTNVLLGAVSAVLVAGAVVSVACGTPIASPAESLGFCILGAAGSDIVDAISDPASLIPVIIAACSKYGLVTVDAIIATIESYFSSAPAASDAAVGASAYEARLHKVLTAALTVAGIKTTEAGTGQ
jgi:hypothetical protein